MKCLDKVIERKREKAKRMKKERKKKGENGRKLREKSRERERERSVREKGNDCFSLFPFIFDTIRLIIRSSFSEESQE